MPPSIHKEKFKFSNGNIQNQSISVLEKIFVQSSPTKWKLEKLHYTDRNRNNFYKTTNSDYKITYINA